MPFGPQHFHSPLPQYKAAASPALKQGRAQQPWETWTAGHGTRQGTRPPMRPAWGLPVGILPGSPMMLRGQHQLQQGHENQGGTGRMPAWLRPQLHLMHG